MTVRIPLAAAAGGTVRLIPPVEIACHVALLSDPMRQNVTAYKKAVREAGRFSKKRPTSLTERMSGGVLLSHAVSHAVPSAQKGLASGFGMGPGVSPSL